MSAAGDCKKSETVSRTIPVDELQENAMPLYLHIIDDHTLSVRFPEFLYKFLNEKVKESVSMNQFITLAVVKRSFSVDSVLPEGTSQRVNGGDWKSLRRTAGKVPGAGTEEFENL